MSVENNSTGGVFLGSAGGSDGGNAEAQRRGFDSLASLERTQEDPFQAGKRGWPETGVPSALSKGQESSYLSGGTATFKVEDLPWGCRDVPKSRKSADDLLDDVSYHGTCSFYAAVIDEAIKKEEAKGHQVKDVTITVATDSDFPIPRPASADDGKWKGTEWERTPHALALTVGHNIRRNLGRSYTREQGRLPAYHYGEVRAVQGNPGEWRFSHELYSEFRPDVPRFDTAMRKLEEESSVAPKLAKKGKRKRPRPTAVPQRVMA